MSSGFQKLSEDSDGEGSPAGQAETRRPLPAFDGIEQPNTQAHSSFYSSSSMTTATQPQLQQPPVLGQPMHTVAAGQAVDPSQWPAFAQPAQQVPAFQQQQQQQAYMRVADPNNSNVVYTVPVLPQGQWHNTQAVHVVLAPKPKPGPLTVATWICFFIALLVICLGFILAIDIHSWAFGLGITVALLPGVLVAYLSWWRNHREKASWDMMSKFAMIGVFGIIPVAVIESLIMLIISQLNASAFLFYFLLSFCVAALVEETFKYAVATQVPVNLLQDHPYSLVLYALAAGLGFALSEHYIFSYIILRSRWIGLAFYVVRGLVAVPMHCFTSVIISCDIAKKKFGLGVVPWYMTMAMPIFLHGMYDFMTFSFAHLALRRPAYVYLISLNLIWLGIAGWMARRRVAALLRLQPSAWIPQQRPNAQQPYPQQAYPQQQQHQQQHQYLQQQPNVV